MTSSMINSTQVYKVLLVLAFIAILLLCAKEGYEFGQWLKQ
jgi:hypothetical protein